MAAQAQTATESVTAVLERRLENSAHRTASDTIHAITESTKQVFAASERLAQDLEEMSARICESADFRTQVAKRPWLIAALTLAGGAVVWSAFNRWRRNAVVQ
jgi:hypothetical protein